MEAWNLVKERTRRWSASITGQSLYTSRGIPFHFDEGEASQPISLDLGSVKLLYKDRQWRQDGDFEYGTDPQLIEKNRVLEAENHLLKFKVNALMDMLTCTKLDMVRLQGELETK